MAWSRARDRAQGPAPRVAHARLPGRQAGPGAADAARLRLRLRRRRRARAAGRAGDSLDHADLQRDAGLGHGVLERVGERPARGPHPRPGRPGGDLRRQVPRHPGPDGRRRGGRPADLRVVLQLAGDQPVRDRAGPDRQRRLLGRRDALRGRGREHAHARGPAAGAAAADRDAADHQRRPRDRPRPWRAGGRRRAALAAAHRGRRRHLRWRQPPGRRPGPGGNGVTDIAHPGGRVARPTDGRTVSVGPLDVASVLAVLAALGAIFYFSPTERVQGDVFRILYVHLSMAWLAYAAYSIVFGASVAYLLRRRRGADNLDRAAAEIGRVCTSLVLATGVLCGT